MPEPESEAQRLPGARRKLRSRHDPAYGPTPVSAPAPLPQDAPPRRREPAVERSEGGAPSNARASERVDGDRGDAGSAPARRSARVGGSRVEGTRRDRRRRRREEEYENLGEVDLPPGFDEDRPLSPPPPSGDPRTVSAEAIQRERVDADAMRVTVRLARRGFEAYLVGGCVRDLLLGVRPKDFDVATAAHPRQIKRVFRNGRIIGRRFKLVHVVYGDKVVETSTFRAEPRQVKGDEDLLIVDDNEFGTAEQDARRRDFTINALFLDPLEWRILDYVGGLEDLDARVLRTIGEPQVRLGEDPVRILRAIKFATRLDFRIDKGTWDAMCRWAPELERSAPPRVAEEVLRLLRSGHSEPAFRLLHQCGALRVVLPAVGEHVQDPQRAERFWPLLAALDREARAGRETDPALALALLYLRPVVERLGRELDQPPFAEGEILDVAGELLEPMIAATRLSRRDVGLARRLLANQRRFTQTPSKRFRPLLFLHSPEFVPSLELLRLVSEASGTGAELVETWRARHAEAREVEPEQVEHLRAKRRRRRRRK
ncbi:MAG: polynucleotide adenylyltransferase PcnB [Planctomycetaceae bacterium]|nr:polynucleotide adenylyltransferase PcnB [Planctomycetaceae bacterium]